MFWGSLVYGLVNSVILALVALGFNLTFGISGIANFAYGALYILAGMRGLDPTEHARAAPPFGHSHHGSGDGHCGRSLFHKESPGK